MRPDGKRVKGLTPIVSIIPYIMPQRYDAQNTVTEYIDEEVIKSYIREKRRAGTQLNHMAVVMAAYYKAVQKNPKLNYFIMNRKIYERNHFCVSFVMLKKRPDGTPDETVLKIYLQPDDTIFTINERIQAAIAKNAEAAYENKTDKFVSFLFSVPGLVRFVVWLARNLDKIGLLPRFVIDLSPFHTSLFISNMASLRMNSIYHHIYNFGTTSVFFGVGRRETKLRMSVDGKLKGVKVYPIGCVIDERIMAGSQFGQAFHLINHYLKNPQLLEAKPEKVLMENVDFSLKEKYKDKLKVLKGIEFGGINYAAEEEKALKILDYPLKIQVKKKA